MTRQPGRPRATSGGLRKGKSIGFTPEEWCKVMDHAEAAGVPVDEYVRCRCLRKRIQKPSTKMAGKKSVSR